MAQAAPPECLIPQPPPRQSTAGGPVQPSATATSARLSTADAINIQRLLLRGGRRIFENESLPIDRGDFDSPRTGRKHFGPPKMGDEIESSRSRGERLALRDELARVLTHDMRDAHRPAATHATSEDDTSPPPFHFLNDEASWKPVGGRPADIPEYRSEFKPKALPKVAETPARLLLPARRTKTTKSEPKASDKPPVDTTKLSDKLFKEQQYRQERHEKAVRQALQSHGDAEPKKLESVDEFVSRMVDVPLAHKERALEKLRAASAKRRDGRKEGSSPVKLTAEQQAAFNERLYKAGMSRERAAVEKAAHKYLDEQPRHKPLPPDQLKEASERLYRSSRPQTSSVLSRR